MLLFFSAGTRTKWFKRGKMFFYPNGRVILPCQTLVWIFYTSRPAWVQFSNTHNWAKFPPRRVPSLEPQLLTICPVFTLISRALVISEKFPTGPAKANKAFSVTSVARDIKMSVLYTGSTGPQCFQHIRCFNSCLLMEVSLGVLYLVMCDISKLSLTRTKFK